MRQILGNLFISDVFIPEAGLLTVTKVKVADDLKLAKVYLSFLENKKPVDDILDILDSKLEMAKKLGATHTVSAKDNNPVEVIQDLTHGGVEIAIESVGNATVLAQAYEATMRGGTTVAIGLPHPDHQFSIPAVTLSAMEKTVKGSYQGSCVPSRDIPKFIEMFHAGQLPVDQLLSDTIKLEEINEGFDRLHKGEVARQVILF